MSNNTFNWSFKDSKGQSVPHNILVEEIKHLDGGGIDPGVLVVSVLVPWMAVRKRAVATHDDVFDILDFIDKRLDPKQWEFQTDMAMATSLLLRGRIFHANEVR